MRRAKDKYKVAPALPKGMDWLNSKGLDLAKLRGKAVLLDFWTYSCVNCIRTIPHVNEWHRKYAKKGLVIIGIHTPEFEFEKDGDNVEDAIEQHGIKYPVVLDNIYEIWNLYSNHWWPRKILLDAKGRIVYDHIGEGAYAETEREIQKVLRRIGAKDLPQISSSLGGEGGACGDVTPELYFGAKRGRFANLGVEVGHQKRYKKVRAKRDEPVLVGEWKIENEHMESGVGSVVLDYVASEVNVVAGEDDAVVEVLLDGKPVPRKIAGDDISFDGNKTVVHIEGSRMYQLVTETASRARKIEMTASEGAKLYSMTFGGVC